MSVARWKLLKVLLRLDWLSKLAIEMISAEDAGTEIFTVQPSTNLENQPTEIETSSIRNAKPI